MDKLNQTKTNNFQTQTQNLSVQTPTSSTAYKSYTFDALASLTQKIHEISEFEHKNYFSTTATHFRIKKGTQLERNPLQPPSQEGSRKPESRFRVISTAGENPRKQAKIYKTTHKNNQNNENGQSQFQIGNDMNFMTISKYNSQVIGFQPSQSQMSVEKNQDVNKRRTLSLNQASTTKNLKNNSTAINFFKSQNHSNSVSVKEIDNQDEILEQNRPLTQNKNLLQAQSLIQNPKQFYHLKSVGFKNYKYPRPPIADQLYSAEARHKIPLYLVKDPIRGGDSNSIEGVCVQQVQQDKLASQSHSIQSSKDRSDQILQYNNNFVSSLDDDTREINSRGSNISFPSPYGSIERTEKQKKTLKYGNKLLYDMDSYNRMVNLHNLELKIEQKNSSLNRNIFSRWKQRDSIPHFNAVASAFMSEQTSPKNQLLKNNNPNLKIVQIDKIDMNPNQVADRSKIKTSMQSVRINQQSKSKKLTTIIEMYNKLVKASEKYRQSGMVLEGESPTKQNKLKILELADESKAKIFKNQQDIYLGVFVQSYDILKDNKPGITSRILSALGLDNEKEFSYVSLEQIIAFYRILIHRDSAISETIKFLEKFLKENSQDLDKEVFKKLMKLLCSQVNDKRVDQQKSIYQYLIDKFEENGVITQTESVVNFKKFKQIFTNSTLNIYDIIDLICGIKE